MGDERFARRERHKFAATALPFLKRWPTFPANGALLRQICDALYARIVCYTTLDVEFDVVFSVCGHAREHCPVFSHAPRLLHVGFDDPPALAKKAATDEEVLNHYRRVRDEIRHFIETLETHLEPECSASNAGLICR